MLDFLKLVLTKEGGFAVPMDDDIVAACLMTQARRGLTASRRLNDETERRPEGEAAMDVVSPTIINLIIFVLAIYVGYHVVWTVTPALHTPLMAVTNAISAIVIVGAMLAAALTETALGKTMGVLAVALAAVNIFGGFLVTRRMLEMFRKKERSPRQARRPQGASRAMSLNLVTLLYLVASVCFIQALKGLSHPTTSIRGNLFGMVGMAIAVVTTAALIVKLLGAAPAPPAWAGCCSAWWSAAATAPGAPRRSR